MIPLVSGPVKIRTMSSTDLRRADELRQLACWNQRATDWQRFLDLSPAGCFVAESDETVIGTVTTISYGREAAWIGMLLVHPDSRGGGIGKALLTRAIEHLRSKRIASIKLDATPLGEALYRKLGFKDEWALTRYKGIVSGGTGPTNEKVRDVTRNDTAQVCAADAQAFGLRRPELIESLLSSARAAIALEHNLGVHAFGLLRSGAAADYLGPVVAQTSKAATEIILELARRSGGQPFYWDIPRPNLAALALAEKLGLVPERQLLRMYLGENEHRGDVQKYFALADPSLG